MNGDGPVVSRVGFTGTQHGMSLRQEVAVSRLLLGWSPVVAHHGDCVGADARFHELVRDALPATRIVSHPPSVEAKRAFMVADEVCGRLPYLERNRRIVDESEVLVACPRSAVEELRSGTWATVRYARKRGVPVYLILPDGTLVEGGRL